LIAGNLTVVKRAEAEAIYDQGRDAAVAVLLRMDEQIQRLEKRVAQQDERIAQLERRMGRSSRTRRSRRAPIRRAARRSAARTGRGASRARRSRPRPTWRQHGSRDVRSLVGLRASTRQAPPGLLVTPAARLRDARRRPRGRESPRRGGPQVCEQLFWAWEIFQHTGDRADLKRRIRALRRELKPILTRHAGTGARYRRGRRFARNLLKSGRRSGRSTRTTA
jgi:hypothetical protein